MAKKNAVSVVEVKAPAVIISEAIAKGANLKEIAELMTLQERWEGNQAKKAYVHAMADFKANAPRVSASVKPGEHDFHVHMVELQNTGASEAMTLPSFVALCSSILRKPVQSQMAVLGDMSLGGSIVPVRNLAETLQATFDAGAKRILLPMASVTDIPTVPGELFAKFQTSFYSDPVDAVFKALGVE